MKIVVYGILLYLLYKLIFDFIIPFSRATSQIKSKIREAQQQHQNRFDQTAPPVEQKAGKTSGTKTGSDSEYIDYEEVK